MTPKLGFTFNHKQAKLMKLDPLQSFETCLHWPIEYVRLGAYWSDIEQKPDKYNVDLLIKYINLCQRYNKKVILTVGVKSPRWPEFYFPKNLKHDFDARETKNALFGFIRYLINTFQTYSCISHWQVENEPLDPSGPDHMIIPFEFLKQEVNLVKSIDKRPIILSVWGNDLSRRKNLDKIESLTDIVGLDLYYKQFAHRFFNINWYRGPVDNDKELLHTITNSSKPIWITELQAEPWEHIVDGWRLEKSGSMNIDLLEKNFSRAMGLYPHVILFWGVEYWHYQNNNGNNKYIEFIQNIHSYFT